MDKTYAQRLHKYELVMRGFFLNSLRGQIKPYIEFYKQHGYFGRPEDLIDPDGLKKAYVDSYRYISDSELYIQWTMLEKDYRNSLKDFTLDDGYTVVYESLRSFFIQAAVVNYINIRNELNATTVRAIESFVNKSREAGLTDDQIYKLLISSFSGDLRTRAGVIGATEANTILSLVKSEVAKAFYRQRGIIGYKTWFTRRDEAVRHTHVEVEGRTLPIDVKFVLNKRGGGIELADQPSDPNLSAENRVNCRCLCEYHSDKDKYKKGA